MPQLPNNSAPVIAGAAVGLKTPTGKVSSKFAAGRTWKRQMRIERAVRLEMMGMFSEEEISAQIGITKQALQYIKKTPSYLSKRVALSSGIVAVMDSELLLTRENLKQEVQEMIPSALIVLRNTILAGARAGSSLNERKLAVSVSQDMLDREGTLAKVSKTSVTLEKETSLKDYDSTADAMLAVLTAHSQIPDDMVSSRELIMQQFKASSNITSEQAKKSLTNDIIGNNNEGEAQPWLKKKTPPTVN
jgi:hypothetical protein